MTDAERLARAWFTARYEDDRHFPAWDGLMSEQRVDHIAAAQALIDSGLVTVTPEPDPAEKIAHIHRDRWESVTTETIRRLLDEGIIAPGPNL